MYLQASNFRRLWGSLGASRVLRGGSWNNNAMNLRAANRNDNHPDNRNNNIGFRVCRGSHIVITLGWGCWPHKPAIAADYGWLREDQARSMAQACPVRTLPLGVGRIAEPDAAWIRSRGVHFFFAPRSRRTLAHPAAEQAAHLAYHGAHMGVLPIIQPAPMMGEPQVQPQRVQCRIRARQRRLPGRTARGLGAEHRFLAIQRSRHQSMRYRMTIGPGKTFAFRQQPSQQVKQTGEQYQFFSHDDLPAAYTRVRGRV